MFLWDKPFWLYAPHIIQKSWLQSINLHLVNIKHKILVYNKKITFDY